jgi:hypothetical protein
MLSTKLTKFLKLRKFSQGHKHANQSSPFRGLGGDLYERQDKRRSLTLSRLYLDIAFMQQHDLFTKAQPNTAAGFAGTEERNKNLVEQFGRHA